ncbi:MAG: type II secretion system F family protein [Actinomycetaceae bacterium]|nr:type II secretion system F family protein [Actinomycetaceae bacterium]
MLNVLLGISLASGLILIWMSLTGQPRRIWGVKELLQGLWRDLLHQADMNLVSGRIWILSLLSLQLLSFLLVLSLTRVWQVALSVALAISAVPIAWLSSRRERHRERLAKAWPDVTDNLLAAVRAGIALPEALMQMGKSGPVMTRECFQVFARSYRSSGRFDTAIEELQQSVVDPQADRLCEALRLAREVGGSELGNVLRDISVVMREDLRVRGELLARQSWTINAARLAVISPWVVLVLISTRTDAAQAYTTGSGIVVLAIGGVGCLGAYLVMKRIAKSGVKDPSLRRTGKDSDWVRAFLNISPKVVIEDD